MLIVAGAPLAAHDVDDVIGPTGHGEVGLPNAGATAFGISHEAVLDDLRRLGPRDRRVRLGGSCVPERPSVGACSDVKDSSAVHADTRRAVRVVGGA